MQLILLDPPGSGKGTYASRLNVLLGVPHISTGDMVRDEIKSQIDPGRRIKEYSDRGELVPDENIVDMLKYRLRESDCERSFILDGFQRTIAQAEALDKIDRIDLTYLKM